MRHPTSVFADPVFADESIDRQRIEYIRDCRMRAPKLSPETIIKYDATLRSFLLTLHRHDEPTTLDGLTRDSVNLWVNDQRDAGLSEHTIANRLAALKVFTHKYLYRITGITAVDLLARVENAQPPDVARTGLSEAEREQILACFTDPTFHDTRDRALMAVVMSTGLRFKEVTELPLSSFDRLHGELIVTGKGGHIREAKLNHRVLKYVREYLRVRPRTEVDRLWVTEYGHALTYLGAHGIIKRVRRKSGLDRLHWHLFRHGFAQHALEKGAHPGMVQEMLGHATAAMTRKYLGAVKQREAARLMPQYSPI